MCGRCYDCSNTLQFLPCNSKNNTLKIELLGTDPAIGNLTVVAAKFALTAGNYTATELRDEIQLKLRDGVVFSETDAAQPEKPKIEVEYDSKVNKYKFTVTGDNAGPPANPELANVIIKSGTATRTAF
jgi:hypothetical protein